jgi:hypothetical protein
MRESIAPLNRCGQVSKLTTQDRHAQRMFNGGYLKYCGHIHLKLELKLWIAKIRLRRKCHHSPNASNDQKKKMNVEIWQE